MIWNVWHGSILVGICNEKSAEDAAAAAREMYGVQQTAKGPITRRLKVSACDTARKLWLVQAQKET